MCMGKKASMLILLGTSYLTLCNHLASSLDADKSPLLAMKARLDSDILANNWTQDTPVCTWIGVTCGGRHPRVTNLDLSSMGLQGSIAPEIGNLSFLAFLSFYNNSITSQIPPEIGNLRRLRVLNMEGNQLSDGVPQSIGLLTQLKLLSLANNKLSGDIPESISACAQLLMLDLSYNAFTGNIPIPFGNLSHLQTLQLRANHLTGEVSSSGMLNISSLLFYGVGENFMSGSIPKHICTHSTNLKVLGLFINQFEGDISSVLSNCHSLKILSLRGNKFRGTIPPSIANSTDLAWFRIGENSFHGTIPPSIANLTNLEVFYIGDNSFQGRIPSEISHLSNLNVLDVGSNELSGEVTASIFNLSKLKVVALQSNNLSGKLPFSIDKGLPDIQEIYLRDNKFDGNIPNSISNLSKLTVVEICNNLFTGHIPTTLGNLPRLEYLSLWENDFTNNMSIPEQDFLSSFSSSTNLEVIDISSNPITGLLPKSFASHNLSASLLQFHANNCHIRSPLPNELGNLTNLILLNLGSNDLSGTIPPALFRDLRDMQKLSLFENQLQGSIPDAICSVENLYFLHFSSNYLSGELPTCLGNLSNLREIYLHNNELNFSIPSTLWIDEHVEVIYLSKNSLQGSIPGDIGNMKDLRALDLSGNQLSGRIPTCISQLQKLINLSLSNNILEGPMPDSLSNLKDLHYLDLSHNILSGPIPTSLDKLVNLQLFNVSFNQLTGQIPSGGPFLNFTPDCFAGNKGLCGVPQFKVGACKRSSIAPSTKRKLLKLVLPVMASVAVAAIFLILVLRLRDRNLPPSSTLDSLLVPTHERISYYTILHATGNLNEENLIGRGSFGSVYMGNFSDAMVAAVKVFNLDVQGAFRSFDTECQILHSVRHRNLVKVITCCTNLDFKALVMAYMPNGNLEKWLYSSTCSLNILQRMKIMMDVASAIEYLHEGYTFPIVHCDLKPSNILLDEDMVAHVGDFGIAKLLTEEQRMQQTKTLGTIGYIAPEYGSQGVVSTMVDVYSYGILLMEVFTRRKPTDEMFSGELTMRIWVSESFPASVMQIVDEELVNTDDHRIRERHERCLASIIELALECTTYQLAEGRPKMKDVLTRMRKINSNLSKS